MLIKGIKKDIGKGHSGRFTVEKNKLQKVEEKHEQGGWRCKSITSGTEQKRKNRGGVERLEMNQR